MEENETKGWYLLYRPNGTYSGPYRTLMEIARKHPEVFKQDNSGTYLIAEVR